MNLSLKRLYEALAGSFWVIPLAMTGGGILLAYLTVSLDESAMGAKFAKWLPMPATQVDGARLVVSTIAGGMITVASLVFSLTLVAVSLLAQQLGPRILPIFMRDRVTQLVLGVFIAVFVYSLMILGVIGTGEQWEFVPQISVHLASFLAVVAFCFVVYFVHHIINSMQADAVIAHLASRMDNAFDAVLVRHEQNGQGSDDDSAPADDEADLEALEERFRSDGKPVLAPHSGYVQMIDYDAAVSAATEHELVVRYIHRPGQFVFEGRPIAQIVPRPGCDTSAEEVAEQILATVDIGSRRKPSEFAEFEVNALVEVALRALSPGVNDPFTAIACIDHLNEGLLSLLRKPLRPIALMDGDDTPRVYRYPQGFEHFMASVYHPLRHAARGYPMVLRQLVSGMLTLAEEADTPPHAAVIADHARELRADAATEILNERDRDEIVGRLDRIIEIVD